MTLEPLFAAPPQVQIHAFSAITAFALGLVQLAAPKGRIQHRILGYIWLALMFAVATSSFGITSTGFPFLRPFGPIHLLSVWVLVTLPLSVHYARRGRIKDHSRVMIGMFVGALVIAGGFTFVSGRLMHAVAFGH